MPRRSIHLCGQEIDRPGHICAFFDSRDEEYETLIPYLKEGVDGGEDVLNVIDAIRLDDHRARLQTAGVSVNAGEVSVASSEDTYLAGGAFDMARMTTFVLDRLSRAAVAGKLVRTAGWMDWITREAPGTERVMDTSCSRVRFGRTHSSLHPRSICGK